MSNLTLVFFLTLDVFLACNITIFVQVSGSLNTPLTFSEGCGSPGFYVYVFLGCCACFACKVQHSIQQIWIDRQLTNKAKKLFFQQVTWDLTS
jgi:hypothetical protein